MEGEGRLADTTRIASRAFELATRSLEHKTRELKERKTDMIGEHLLVTAGPTREYLDPVRFITNRSSGKMGYAIAAAAQERGAQVTLISGPVNIEPPSDLSLVKVTTTREMYDAV